MKKNKTIIKNIACAVFIATMMSILVCTGCTNKREANDISVRQASQNITEKVVNEKIAKEQREKAIEANNEALTKIKSDTEANLATQASEREEAARIAEENKAVREAAAQASSSQNSYSQPSYYYDNSDYEEEVDSTEAEETEETEEIEEAVAESDTGSVETANGTVAKQDSSHFKRDGVIYDENGTRYTWYSSNVLHHYRTSEWSVNDEGFYETSDGNLVVASEDYPEGTIIDTPYGTAEVLDNGCDSGTVDFYVNY